MSADRIIFEVLFWTCMLVLAEITLDMPIERSINTFSRWRDRPRKVKK